MALTPLPSVATVNDVQLAKLLEVYGDTAGYQARMIKHMIEDIKRHEQAKVQVVYQQRLAELNAQEAQAEADIDIMLQNLSNP